MTRTFDQMMRIFERIRRGEGRFKDFHYLKLMIECLYEFNRMPDGSEKAVSLEIDRRLYDLYNYWRIKPGDWKGGEEDRFNLIKTGQYWRIVENYKKPNGRWGYKVLISLGRMDEDQASKLLEDLRQGRAEIRTDEYGHKYVKRLSV